MAPAPYRRTAELLSDGSHSKESAADHKFSPERAFEVLPQRLQQNGFLFGEGSNDLFRVSILTLRSTHQLLQEWVSSSHSD